MNARQRRHRERAQRVDVHLDTQPEGFPNASKGLAAATSLKEELVTLAALDVALTAATSKRQQGTAQRGNTRGVLRGLVETVTAAGETIALDHTQLKGVFSLKGIDRSDQTLAAVARSHADNAAPFVAFFVEYGLAAAFVQDLRAQAENLEQAVALQNEGVGARAEAYAAVEESLRRLAEIIERLDIAVRIKYRDDPAKLAAWERARRIESAPQHRDDDEDTPEQPATTATP